MTSRSIYVAGPMTGLPEFNFPAFDRATERLKADGWYVTNPADHDRALGFDERGLAGNESHESLGFDLAAALLWDLEQVAHSDAIYLLNGWESSRGARAEHALAVALGKGIIREPTRPRLIGLGGRLAAGKDEVADAIVSSGEFVKVGMSDVMQAIGRAQNPWILLDKPLDAGRGFYYPQGTWVKHNVIVETVGYTEAKTYQEVREYYQRLGTQVGREILGENVWVDAIRHRIRALWEEGKRVVVTGIRFPNEVDLIDGLGGETVWVSRPGHEAAHAVKGHASETSVGAEDFAQVIVNDGTLDDLRDKARALILG